MSKDKLRFAGTCLISFSIISLAVALFYIGYEASQMRRAIPGIEVETNKILTTMKPIIEKKENGNNLISEYCL